MHIKEVATSKADKQRKVEEILVTFYIIDTFISVITAAKSYQKRCNEVNETLCIHYIKDFLLSSM